MTTQYNLTDRLPKDSGGQKFAALVDAQTSQLDFAMQKGIGTSSIGSKNLAHMAIGTHTQGSVIEALHPLTAIGGVFIENAGASPAASPVSSGQAQIAVMSNWGELFTTGAPKTASQVSTSANLIKNGSGIVYGFTVSVSGASPSNVIRLRDGTRDMFTFIATSRFQSYSYELPQGGVAFNTTIAQSMTITENFAPSGASVTVIFR